MPFETFTITDALFAAGPPGVWTLAFEADVDPATSTLDLADWAIFKSPVWVAPTAIIELFGAVRLLHVLYDGTGTRVRFTGPENKVFDVNGATLSPFDLPIPIP